MKGINLNTVLAAVLFPIALLGFLVAGIILFFVTLPNVDLLRSCFTTSMNQVQVCPDKAPYVRLNQISPLVMEAVVASEDAAFFSHKGFDWHEIQESLTRNLEAGEYKRGGSTISQQLVKNAFLSKKKSLLRKLREAALTVSLESHFTKKEILEKYLNIVEFGPQIYGVNAAARHYFQRSPADINLLQATFLAFLLPNPKEYSSSHARGALTPFARKSITVILRRLLAFKKISEADYQLAASRLDEFPWQGISVDAFAHTTDPQAPPPTDEQIQKILDDEPFDESVVIEPQSEPQPETPEQEIIAPVESESNSTWD